MVNDVPIGLENVSRPKRRMHVWTFFCVQVVEQSSLLHFEAQRLETWEAENRQTDGHTDRQTDRQTEVLD